MKLLKNRKPFDLCSSNLGTRFCICKIIWALVGLILIFHVHSIIIYKSNTNSKVSVSVTIGDKELKVVEEEPMFMLPPRRKHSPHAVKRIGGRVKKHQHQHPTVIDEFLDESSKLRPFFFPDRRPPNDTLYYYPGERWVDTDGNLIQAHGGGVLVVENTYYWYGENKDGRTYHAHSKSLARVDIIGVNCYSSNDLRTWKNEGVVLPAEKTNQTHDLYTLNVLERPKVIFNDETSQYVMWMHIDNANYTKASIGVAVSEKPTGPFKYLYSKRPNGFDSRDMTIFKDDNGLGYLIYSSDGNNDLRITLLTNDYLDVTTVMRKTLVGRRREAPAVFKHQNTYYMITSGCSGWAPNRAMAHAADSMLGPWETLGNPCVGGNLMFRMTTFFSQGTFVVPLPGVSDSFVFMADRWNPADLKDSRYVWLPLTVGGLPDAPLEYDFAFPLWSRITIYWHKKWKLPNQTQL
ncbi:exo-beta-1,3-galactanase, family GH43 [Zostera marina]|uniref:Exo-beta-1,3-galactanase, family GH43 n=1 Tax=Zostera marina TaxID=29655 RepID=A0A0K9NGS0_ZOSMR|nr:exo-beta-1,3-galactanase, family GH43 [Zostera marina]